MNRLWLMDDIIEEMKEKYGDERIWILETRGWDLTNTPKRRNRDKDRNDWADKAVKCVFGKARDEIIRKDPKRFSTGEYNFSYIKFAINEDGTIYGVVNGLSCFHKYYPSDIWFYALPDKDKPKLTRLMEEYKLKWYVDKILLLKNKNPEDRSEACDNEKWMHDRFYLKD